MNREIADKILASMLQWDEERVIEYRELISDFAELKFDSYEQFTPGNKFMESLLIWLSQFESPEDRRIMLDFVLNEVVFISPNEMNQLLSMVYPDVIEPFLEVEAEKLGATDSNIAEYVNLLRSRSLVLGLSDGAKTAHVRRLSDLSHEQIKASYELSAEVLKDARDKMETSFNVARAKIDDDLPERITENPFLYIFLLDDFSGSGISYIRKENDEMKGKIKKVKKIFKDAEIDITDTKFVLIIYMASDVAKNHLDECLGLVISENQFEVKVIQQIQQAKIPPEVEAILEKVHKSQKNEYITESYELGGTEKPYLGFNQCSLALVLSHNTPNNSLPVLWYSDDEDIALFPRISRHKD